MVAHIRNPCTQEIKAGGLPGVQSLLDLQIEILAQIKQNGEEKKRENLLSKKLV